MVIVMRGTFNKTSNQDMEFTFSRIWIVMKVIGQKEIAKEKGSLSWLVVSLMKENGVVTKSMEKESKLTKTAVLMMDSSKMMRKAVKVWNFTKEAINLREFG